MEENWKVEVKRLDVIRENLKLNWNQLEKLTGVTRGRIANMFKMVNEPSLGFYLIIKSTLENEFKVFVKKKKDYLVIPSKPRKIVVDVGFGENEFTCGCTMSVALFIRSKNCKKTKEEHKF